MWTLTRLEEGWVPAAMLYFPTIRHTKWQLFHSPDRSSPGSTRTAPSAAHHDGGEKYATGVTTSKVRNNIIVDDDFSASFEEDKKTHGPTRIKFDLKTLELQSPSKQWLVEDLHHLPCSMQMKHGHTFNTASEISGKCFDSFVNYEINGSINRQPASLKPRLKSIIFRHSFIAYLLLSLQKLLQLIDSHMFLTISISTNETWSYYKGCRLTA